LPFLDFPAFFPFFRKGLLRQGKEKGQYLQKGESMFKHLAKKNALELEIKTTHLNATQIQMIKTINSYLVQVLTASDEESYFENSSLLLKSCATAVVEANYNHHEHEGTDKLRHSSQALSYAIDALEEGLNSRVFLQKDH
jgi:hypothetical protein